jgi:type IV fimbrial biogenesis protein FimT
MIKPKMIPPIVRKIPDCCGMTLIELLVAMSVLTILLAVGVPSFGQFMANTQLSGYANTMFSHLALARSEAIKRNSRVAICKSSDGSTCASTGDWNQGWIVFADTDNSGSINADEQLITVMPALSSGFSFVGNSSVSSYISYDSQGMTKLKSGGFQAGTITLCPAVPAPAGNGREIILSGSGRSRIAKISTCS